MGLPSLTETFPVDFPQFILELRRVFNSTGQGPLVLGFGLLKHSGKYGQNHQ